MPPGVISANITFPDLFRRKLETIKALIAERITIAQIELYHRPISLQQPKPTKFPCVFVQPDTWTADLNTTAKYDFWGTALLYCYFAANDAAAAGQGVESMLAVLDKLFSDNALDDRLTATPTRKFYVNVPANPNQNAGWIESRFGPVTYSSVLAYQRDRSSFYLAAARASFRFHDVIVH